MFTTCRVVSPGSLETSSLSSLSSLYSVHVLEEFATYIRYARRLNFFEKPDYEYLRKLFTDLMSAEKMTCDWHFDWVDRQVSTSSRLVSVNLFSLCNGGDCYWGYFVCIVLEKKA